MSDYPFGKTITEDNYQALRNIALKMTAKDFRETTRFGHGVHNRLRRFQIFIEYKKDEKEKAIKYGYLKKASNSKRVTVADVYSKLEQLELEVKAIKAKLS